MSVKTDEFHCSGCWQALDFNIDTMVAACYSNSLPPFWQGFKGVAQGPCISSTNIAEQRIHPYALAFSFFKIREQASSNNTVLPGSSTNVSLGADWASLNAQQTLQAVNDGNYDAGLFWQAFYDAINAGVASNCSPNFYTISRDQLKALHVHQYDWTFYWTDPAVIDNGIANGTISPLGSVAWNATVLRKGADWFRSRYNSNADIPLDIYVSEFGQDWRLIYGPDATGIVNDQYGNHRDWHQYVWPRTWAGGWRGFKSGLSWWNSWLCWLTRRAPYECQLSGWDITTRQHTVHAGIHDPHMEPYTSCAPQAASATPNPWYVSNGVRNATYFNVNTLTPVQEPTTSYRQFIVVPGLQNEGRFMNSFTTWGTRNWGGYSWRLGPFAAAYATWATVGADDYRGGPLSNSWVFNTQSGTIGTVNLTFQECYQGSDIGSDSYSHYYTVCVPVIKGDGTYANNDRIYFRWQNSVNHGYIYLNEFVNSATYNINSYAQYTPSAMVIPILCRATITQPNCPVTVQFSVIRENASSSLWIGRPVILPYGCSWLSDQ